MSTVTLGPVAPTEISGVLHPGVDCARRRLTQSKWRRGEFRCTRKQAVSAVVVSLALFMSFALLITVHCSLAFGLITRTALGWRGLWLALPVLALLAPYWGFRHGLRARSVAWLFLFTMYLGLLALGSTWSTETNRQPRATMPE